MNVDEGKKRLGFMVMMRTIRSVYIQSTAVGKVTVSEYIITS